MEAPNETGRIVGELFCDIASKIGPPPDDLDRDEAVHIADALWSAADLLAQHAREWRQAAADLLLDVEYNPREGLWIDGQVYHHNRSVSYQWDGHGVLRDLSIDHIDPDTGEVVKVVPTHVLEDVLPAVSEGATSSRWLTKGLASHGIDVGEYREPKFGPWMLQRGVKR